MFGRNQQFCKAIILQLKNKLIEKKRHLTLQARQGITPRESYLYLAEIFSFKKCLCFILKMLATEYLNLNFYTIKFPLSPKMFYYEKFGVNVNSSRISGWTPEARSRICVCRVPSSWPLSRVECLPGSWPESRRVSLGAHWVDSRESSLLRRLERGREIGR